MELGIKGKTALVTGASKGIGLAIARGLVAEGVRVVISSRDAELLVTVAEEIGAEAIPADVSDPAQITRLLATMKEGVGHPDILVVNAGGPPTGQADSLEDEAWAMANELTLMSAVRLARGCLPSMKDSGWGRIINVTSRSVKDPIPNLALSNALRAVTNFARTLATEVASSGITVNNVGPGATDTDRLRSLYPTPEAMDAAMQNTPTGRAATPEEVASAAVYLAGGPAAMITGQTIYVDGGA